MIKHTLLILLTRLCGLNTAYAEELPNLMCSSKKSVIVSYPSLESKIFNEEKIYRIQDKKLYVNDLEKKEYLYGDIDKDSNSTDRYVSAYKTIIFSNNFQSATVTHASSSDTQISEWLCQKMAN